MIRSMTGFGDASEEVHGVHYAVELRSLNNRYFKGSIRLPEQIAGLDAELDALLRKRLGRGSVSLTVSVKADDAAAARRINDAALVAYLEHLRTLQQRLADSRAATSIDLTALLSLPGVMETTDEDLLERSRPVVLRLTEMACERLSAMRQVEGRALAQDLARQVQAIRQRLASVTQRAPVVVEEYHQRLRSRIDELLAKAQLKVQEQDLLREVAIYADRADISEEITRLTGHLDQLERHMARHEGEPAGRTLDFIAQEMLREANTIASKSNDAAISRDTVEIKSAIDRIKEQVQNVE